MIYSFDGRPTPVNNPLLNEHFTQHQSWLSEAEIQWIRDYGDKLDRTSVKLYKEHDESHVKASGSHFHLNDDTSWLYDKMAMLTKEINDECYQFDLSGFKENFYYLRYDGPGEHFNWHLDIGPKTPAPRKLSLVLQLSEPSEYEGGELDILEAIEFQRAEKQKGVITAFPAYKVHRVTPVTSGIRRTLVIFAAGPNFR